MHISNIHKKMKGFFCKKNIPVLVLIVFGILFFAMGILSHYFYRTHTYDYGNYVFAFWDYSHFRLSTIPTNIPLIYRNFLQDHFSFTLMYFVPVFWLFNWLTQTYTLILIQYSMVLVAAWYSYKIIKLKSDNLWLGAGIMVYYFTLLGRYTSFTADVNIAIISACFIPIFIYYFEIKKYFIALAILILSLFSRENIPIWFVFIFIVLIIQHRKDKKAILYSLVGILLSIIYFILLFKVFFPSIETPGVKFSLFNYSALGNTPAEALSFIIHHPVDSFKMFFINHTTDLANDGIKAEFYWVFLISGGFVLFLRPQYLIWFIPIVAQKVLNDNPYRWGIASYYAIEIFTLLPVSVFLVLSSLKSKSLQTGLAIAVCIATISVTIHMLDQKNNKIQWAINPLKTNFYEKRFFEPPFNIKGVNQLLKKIPSTAKVSASNNILPHLAQRQFIYLFPYVGDAEYIVFSVFDDTYFYSHEINEKDRNQYFSDPKWEVIASEHPVYLLKLNNAPSSSSKSKLQLTGSLTDTLFCDYETIDKTKGTILFSNEQKADTITYLTTEKSHSGKHSLKLTTERPFNTPLKFNDIKNIRYLQISLWAYGPENDANIIASDGKDLYLKGSITVKEPSGWNYFEINFVVPQEFDATNFAVYLWNSGTQPTYFDDLRIIKKYMK